MDPSTPTPSVLPWDTTQGNRFAPYSPENHSATLWIASLLALTYSIGVLLIRLFIKRKVLGLDDWLIIASTIIGAAEYITTYRALDNGLGKTAAFVPHIANAATLVFTSRILLLVSLYLSKCSGIFLLRRLFVRDDRGNSLLCDLSLFFTVICGIASIFIGSVGCPSSGFFQQQCSGQIMRWSIVTGLDVVTEVLSLVLPPYLVWQLQMKTAYKFRVIVAFCFRLLVVVFSILHLNAWIEYSNGPPSPFLIIPVLIWQQALLGWSLISATIPNLKAFLQSMSTHWGIDVGYSSNAYGTHGGTFELQSMKRSGARESLTPFSSQGKAFGAKFKTEVTTTTIRERSGSGENASVGSSGSQDLIIRKDTQWVIESTSASPNMF